MTRLADRQQRKKSVIVVSPKAGKKEEMILF